MSYIHIVINMLCFRGSAIPYLGAPVHKMDAKWHTTGLDYAIVLVLVVKVNHADIGFRFVHPLS